LKNLSFSIYFFIALLGGGVAIEAKGGRK